MRASSGARILLTHSPDVLPSVPDDVTLILAGHTHCGQIRLPVIGPIATMSHVGKRFACGLRRAGAKRIITSAGLGTSRLPLRLGAVPDVWLLTLGPRS
jgi:predicted MPP superfamily phosphohydrolase